MQCGQFVWCHSLSGPAFRGLVAVRSPGGVCGPFASSHACLQIRYVKQPQVLMYACQGFSEAALVMQPSWLHSQMPRLWLKAAIWLKAAPKSLSSIPWFAVSLLRRHVWMDSRGCFASWFLAQACVKGNNWLSREGGTPCLTRLVAKKAGAVLPITGVCFVPLLCCAA